MLTTKEKAILDRLEDRAAFEDVEVVSVEVVGAKRAPTIRVYIDNEHGISFDELARSQAWISDIMDEMDPFPGAYTLEVSSPGIDRPLRTPEHFQRFSGETVNIKTDIPVDGRSSFTGTLLGYHNLNVSIEVDTLGTLDIPYDHIKRARLKGTVDFKG